MKKRALISVSDKIGLIEFAQFLEQNNYELISTGGTFKHLKEAGLNPIPIDEDARVKNDLANVMSELEDFIIQNYY